MTHNARRRGLSLVEAAMVLPLLMLISLGGIEYGWLFVRAGQLTNATRQGARMAVGADATTQEVQDAVAALMAAADMGESGYTVAIAPADIGAAATGEILTVTVSVPYENVGIGMAMFPTPATLSSSVSMAKEGPPVE
jgi:Flp pilus assembly protein TadG